VSGTVHMSMEQVITAVLTVFRKGLRVFNPVPGKEEQNRRRDLLAHPEEV